MVRHRRAPRMQHRGEADPDAEPLGVRRDRQQRLRARLEQEIVDHRLVLMRDRADPRRQREHDVEVGHLQQLGLARFHPFTRLAALALRAMPIAAAVVSDGRVLALLAARDMAAEGRRAATLDCEHHLDLDVAQMTPPGVTPRRAVVAEDIYRLSGQAIFAPFQVSPSRRTALRMTTSLRMPAVGTYLNG